MFNKVIPFIPLIIFAIMTIALIFPINDYLQSCIYHTNATGVKPC